MECFLLVLSVNLI